MPLWLVLSNGPVLRFTLIFLILGLARLAVITLLDAFTAIRSTGFSRINLGRIAHETFGWLIPIRRLGRSRKVYSFASFGFHLGLLLSGLFLANHLEILQTNFRVSWTAIWKPVLDIFAVLMIASGGYLLYHRIYNPGSRRLSRAMDYILLVVLLNIAVSGFVAGQPWNPFSYNGLMLFHTLNGILILLVLPFSKIAHCILFPLIRLCSEIGWQFQAAGGQRVVESLYGPDGRSV